MSLQFLCFANGVVELVVEAIFLLVETLLIELVCFGGMVLPFLYGPGCRK
jgi:hypothetical protein